jgi:hypothetical protein
MCFLVEARERHCVELRKDEADPDEEKYPCCFLPFGHVVDSSGTCAGCADDYTDHSADGAPPQSGGSGAGERPREEENRRHAAQQQDSGQAWPSGKGLRINFNFYYLYCQDDRQDNGSEVSSDAYGRADGPETASRV